MSNKYDVKVTLEGTTLKDLEDPTAVKVYMARGEKGDKGSTGDAATVGVGSVTTLPAGSNATVSNSGTSGAAVFDFGIPQGVKGDKGEKGEKGEKGDKGDRGEQGIQGPVGKDFSIAKTYSSIADMKADKDNVDEGDFVMITSNVEDPDNAKLFVRTSYDVADEAFNLISDLSGAQGMKGDKGDQGVKGDKGDKGDQGVKGDTGDDGYSPTATVTKAGKVATITITDKNGTTTAQVTDGEDGQGSGDMLKSTYDTDGNGIVDNAEKVNHHTVLSDVPANAVFTDTPPNNATLTIQANGTTVNTFTANASSDVTADIPSATTARYGVTKLSSSTSSTSTTLAATASAVRTAYNLANGKASITLSTTDIGEGATLAADTLYGVYS